MAQMIHTKFGYVSITEAQCDGRLEKYFKKLQKKKQSVKKIKENRHDRK